MSKAVGDTQGFNYSHLSSSIGYTQVAELLVRIFHS